MSDDLGLSPSPAEGYNGRGGEDWPALWFSQDPVARLIVGRDLTILAVNQHALRLLDGSGPICVRDGVLAGKGVAELSIAVTDVGSGSRLCVVGAAVLVETCPLGADVTGPVGLKLRDLNAVVEIECADLESVFGVTPGEHQVIVQLLKGQSSHEIAARFGKSILTVRTHVKRAYGKIGVKTRGQLFARLLPYLAIR